MTTSSPFVLVHGGCHRSDCWGLLVQELAALGRAAIAVDLPGYGRDVGADPQPKGLGDGVDAVVAAVRRLNSPVILVGHSLGGMVISGAADRLPESVSRLVYLTAVLPRDGESALSHSERHGLEDNGASFMLDDGKRVGIVPEWAWDGFYGDCPRAVAEAAIASLVPTDLGCLTEPVSLSDERFGRIPKAYIVCREDRAIPAEKQRLLGRLYPGTSVYELESAHAPFLSMPRTLATLLHGL